MAQLYDFPLGVSEHDPNFEKIQQMIADFRGYETLESLKAADDQVRRQLAEQLNKALGDAKKVRERLSTGMHLQVLPDFDRIVDHLRADYEKMSRPETEKLAACHLYRPVKDLVGELYAIDFKILNDANNVYNLMQEFQRMVREDMMLANIHKIDMSLEEIAGCLEKKGQIIGCMIE
ncbi:MAG: hypothetical protein WBZ29_16215 [Methanocella sp.]